MHDVRLSSSEIGGLWSNYINESMSLCLLKYFLHHNKDREIKTILKKAKELSEQHLKQIREIFLKEKFPIPEGFSDNDINLSAPPLFYDSFGVSYTYMMSRMGMVNYGFVTANVARADVMTYFTTNVKECVDLYNESTTLMLSKGIYDRPPMIPYPTKVEYIKKISYLDGLIGKKRPLNVLELNEIFFNIERNYFSVLLCVGLLQVIKDKEILTYIKEGKDISEKQINMFNKKLRDENFLGVIAVSMEVTDSTISPFSNKLVMALFQQLNAIDITLLGHALSLSLRTDLATEYNELMEEILIYSGKGFKIMEEHNWMEQPPGAYNRKVPK